MQTAVGALIRADAARALSLHETLLAGCYEKAAGPGRLGRDLLRVRGFPHLSTAVENRGIPVHLGDDREDVSVGTYEFPGGPSRRLVSLLHDSRLPSRPDTVTLPDGEQSTEKWREPSLGL